MIRAFTIDETVAGFGDGDVQLTGQFRWEFDGENELLLSYAAENLTLTPEQLLADNGISYRFSYDTQDFTTRRELEEEVEGSTGYRDTAHLVVRLIEKHVDGYITVTNVLGTAELHEPGDRYYIPPLP